MAPVADGGGSGRDAWPRHAIGMADAIEDGRDLGREIAPSRAQARQPVDLGEAAQHDRVGSRRDQGGAGIVVLHRHIFRIGAVEDEQDILAQAGAQPLQLRAAEQASGRIVGIGQEQDPGPRRDPGEEGLDLGIEAALRREHDIGAVGRRHAAEIEIAVAAHQGLIARPEIGLADQPEQLHGAGAADDLGCGQALGLGDRLAKRACIAVGIAGQLGERLAQGLDGGRRRRGCILVLVEADQPAAGCVALRELIGLESGDMLAGQRI